MMLKLVTQHRRSCRPEQLYYLMSRGISRTEAERLVIHGFLDPVVRELPIGMLNVN